MKYLGKYILGSIKIPWINYIKQGLKGQSLPLFLLLLVFLWNWSLNNTEVKCLVQFMFFNQLVKNWLNQYENDEIYIRFLI